MQFRLKSIKHKLRLSFLVIILLSAAGGLLSFLLLSKVTDYQETQKDIDNLIIYLGEARKAEKDFLLYDWKTVSFLDSGRCDAVERHREYVGLIKGLLKQVREDDIVRELALRDELRGLLSSVNSYENSFSNLRIALRTRGFKDHGLEGEMRDYVHALQQCESAEEQVFAFGLRRHEKDFMLRKDLKYIDRLHSLSADFKNFVLEAALPHMNEDYVYRTTNSIDAYRRHFDRIVDIEERIGLTNDTGIRGELAQRAAEVEPRAANVQAVIAHRIRNYYSTSTWLLIASPLLLLLVGVILSFVLSSAIAKPVILLDDVTKAVLRGMENAEERLKNIRLKDEIGSLVKNFQFMVRSMKEHMKLVTEKNEKLERAAEEEARRTWAIEGLAEFGEILKNTSDLKSLSQVIVSRLVQYTKSNQGALFILNDEVGEVEDDWVMECAACYAYDRQKLNKKAFTYGEGQVGSAWRDRDVIFLTEVPSSYVRIRSGLGDAMPRCVLVVPIMNEYSVEGVIELAAFHVYSEHEISFVKTLAERLATTIRSVKMQDKTSLLLAEANQMTQQLRESEEEMRQNVEELQATQEELSRNNQDADDRISDLERDLELYAHLVGRMSEGVVIADASLRIRHANAYVAVKLRYDAEELQGMPVDALLANTTAEQLLNSMESDPNYILNRFTEEMDVTLVDKYNAEQQGRLVMTKLMVQGEAHYSFLLSKDNYKEAQRYVAQVLDKQRVN